MSMDFQSLSTQLSSALLCDALDGIGLRDQALRSFVRPLDETKVIMGTARTGRFVPVDGVRENENPYDVEIALIDDLRPGDVPVLSCDGPTERIVPWGELLTTAAKARRANGCVTDGLVRDVRKISAMQFPVFHGGFGPLDSRGRGKMVERDVRVRCAGAEVASGDIIFGDVDGVVVVPQNVAEQVIAAALAKANSENDMRADLLRGDRLTDVFARYGIL